MRRQLHLVFVLLIKCGLSENVREGMAPGCFLLLVHADVFFMSRMFLCSVFSLLPSVFFFCLGCFAVCFVLVSPT